MSSQKMLSLKDETNIEVLRQYSALVTMENERLRELVASLTQPGSVEWLSTDLRDQLSRLQKKYFGFGRESLKPRTDRPVGHSGEQLKLHGLYPRKQESKGAKKAAPDEAPEVIHHDMPDNDLEKEASVRELSADIRVWKKMKDFYQESVEITVTERIYKKVIHRQAKYRLKDEYNTTGKEVIITAPGPVKLKPGCQYSVDFGLAVVSDKYEFHMPLERQRRKMQGAGLKVDVKTLYNLCQTVAEHMETVVPRIRQDIMNDFCAVHIDESPWLIISQKKRGQMWAMSNRIGSYYQFEPTRAGEVAEEMLKGHSGAVLTDALAAYNRLKNIEGIRRGLCWAHVRREFYERMDDFPVAEEMVRMIDELFEIEAKAKTFDELRDLRKRESKAVITLMQSWLLEQSQKYLPSEGIMAAIAYCANHWLDLKTFLTDLSLPLSNNDAERALRHVVLGRKNFAGSKTINGADVAATLYTVIESAKKCSLQPKEYMKYVITERWHKREPKTPLELSAETVGTNDQVEFPAKEDWQIA
ncbi:MAG: IS66 family transposase [Bdellovibrionales bacterium]|nr:IS66 family transposase [Bdellovibrionales bacterium]